MQCRFEVQQKGGKRRCSVAPLLSVMRQADRNRFSDSASAPLRCSSHRKPPAGREWMQHSPTAAALREICPPALSSSHASLFQAIIRVFPFSTMSEVGNTEMCALWRICGEEAQPSIFAIHFTFCFQEITCNPLAWNNCQVSKTPLSNLLLLNLQNQDSGRVFTSLWNVPNRMSTWR